MAQPNNRALQVVSHRSYVVVDTIASILQVPKTTFAALVEADSVEGGREVLTQSSE